MLPINKKISAYNHYNYNTIKYIVVHDVGAKSTAKNNVDYFAGGNRNASAHYFVDDTSIWQSVEDNKGAWHVGDNNGVSDIYNTNSIGIEMCLPSGTVTAKTEANTVELVKYLMKKYNVPINRVVRHYDASRKNCPAQFNLDGKWTRWTAFKKKLTTTTVQPQKTETKPTAPAPKPTTKTIDQLADEVIAGKHGTGDARKKALGSQYNAVQKRVNEKLGATVKPKAPAKKSNDTIAQEVINGQWGNGTDRTNRLKKAGYNPTTIQNLVNQKLGVKATAKPKVAKKTNAQIAREIYNGVGNWGTGQTRIDRLRKAGYDPVAVQREVNKLF